MLAVVLTPLDADFTLRLALDSWNHYVNSELHEVHDDLLRAEKGLDEVRFATAHAGARVGADTPFHAHRSPLPCSSYPVERRKAIFQSRHCGFHLLLLSSHVPLRTTRRFHLTRTLIESSSIVRPRITLQIKAILNRRSLTEWRRAA